VLQAGVLNGFADVWFNSGQWLMNATGTWSGNQRRTVVALCAAGGVEDTWPLEPWTSQQSVSLAPV